MAGLGYDSRVVGLELCNLALLLFWGSTLSASGITVPYIYTETARYDAVQRFPSGAVLHLVSNGRNDVLFPGFAASADASISVDGRRVLFAGKQKPGDRWQIWEAPFTGGTPRRVVTVNEDCISPFYLPADRIVFARRMSGGFELQVAPLTGGPASAITFGPGNPIVSDVLRDGRVLFESTHGTGIRDLYTVYTDGSGVETHRCDHRHDRHSGRELSSGDIVFETGGKLARFTSARAVEVPMSLPSAAFAGPIAEINDTQWLVSSGNTLYLWTPGQAKLGDPVAANAVQPVLVRPRTRPKIHPSSLGNREGANTLCLNVYTSKLQIPQGSVATVRAWAQDERGAPIALGIAPVEPDGSFFVTIPADRPVRFELLDKAGKTIAAERGWFWYRPGEQRICVGCHAGPERAADNVQPQILLRSTEPAKLWGLK
jgi:Hydrazine synthase alpha subunit middle domain